MELGISMFGDLPLQADGKRKPASERIEELLKEIQLADETGLDVFGIGEHHRADYAVTNPEIILAAAAAVTKRIKLGSAVSVLSSADPIRIYQNFATVDLLSGGRAELMAGRGSFIESFPLFGYELRDYDTLFEEKLDLLLTVNKQSVVSWSGKFRKALKDQPVFPRPLQKQLPVWIAVGGTPESVERAGRLGLPLMLAIIGGQPAQFRPLVDFYKSTYLQHGHDPALMQIGVHAHTLVGKDSRDIADKYFPSYAAQMTEIGKERGWSSYSRQQFDAGRSNHGALLIGSPEEVAEKILAFQKMFGLTRFVAHMDVGGPSHAMLMESIHLFGTAVSAIVRENVSQQ